MFFCYSSFIVRLTAIIIRFFVVELFCSIFNGRIIYVSLPMMNHRQIMWLHFLPLRRQLGGENINKKLCKTVASACLHRKKFC